MENVTRLAQNKIEQKKIAFSQAEQEYNKLHTQTERYSKTLDEIKEKKYIRESLLKSFEGRMLKFEQTEGEFKTEVTESNKVVAVLRLKILELQKSKGVLENLFIQDVKQMVQKICSERERHIKNVLSEEIQVNYEENHSLDQEIEDLENILKKLKEKYPILCPTSQESINENCIKQMPLIKDETRREKQKNFHFEDKRKIYENSKNIILQEIQKMEEQL